MDADFWHNKWAQRLIGFHQSDTNPFLAEGWGALGLDNQGEVLVPLCGKTLDMMWLKTRGHSVLGVELSAQALDEFVEEHRLDAAPLTHTHYCGYQLKGMRLFCGDFFHLSAEDCQNVVGVYDRAALIALPPDMRKDYARHLIEVLPPTAPIFLVTMTYDEGDSSPNTSGPPFSVSDNEVLALFSPHFDCRLRKETETQRKGQTIREAAWHLIPKSL